MWPVVLLLQSAPAPRVPQYCIHSNRMTNISDRSRIRQRQAVELTLAQRAVGLVGRKPSDQAVGVEDMTTSLNLAGEVSVGDGVDADWAGQFGAVEGWK